MTSKLFATREIYSNYFLNVQCKLHSTSAFLAIHHHIAYLQSQQAYYSVGILLPYNNTLPRKRSGIQLKFSYNNHSFASKNHFTGRFFYYSKIIKEEVGTSVSTSTAMWETVSKYQGRNKNLQKQRKTPITTSHLKR